MHLFRALVFSLAAVSLASCSYTGHPRGDAGKCPYMKAHADKCACEKCSECRAKKMKGECSRQDEKQSCGAEKAM